jgi:signal transduction histidine kinase
VTGLAPTRRRTLDLAHRLSVAGRSGVTAAVFLEDVCGAVAEAFEFDSVAAVGYDAEAEEVSDIAFAGAAPADRTERQPIAGRPLLAEANESRNLVLVSVPGGATCAFALPLVSRERNRLLAFLYGTRSVSSFSAETDAEALAAVGIVATTLLEHALVREEMQELDMLKSEFIALAAHELRTPLSSIYGLSVTLDERGDELAQAERVSVRNALREQTARLQDLVEQLLDLSRLDLGAIHLAPEHVRLRPKIEELLRTLAGAGPEEVTIAVSPDLEAVVDPAALDRMLSNLIVNSLRHGKPPIIISAEGEDRHLRFAVEDRGSGVPREFVPHLFDRFARESHARANGSGLGLAIAQAYARAHGGEIVYEPAVPHGARFEVVIPRRGYGDKRPRIELSGADVHRHSLH